MNYFLYDAAGGKWELPAPLWVTLKKDEDTPADSLAAEFPLSGLVPSAAFLRAEEDETVWFDGILDTMRSSYAASNLLAVSARSRAALLLDSEALPAIYENPSLGFLYQQHAAPYGFHGINGNSEPFTGEYAVEKGSSEWQALDGFCREFLKEPLREENGLLTAEPIPEREPFYLGENGIPCLQVSQTQNLCRMLSETWAIDGTCWKRMNWDEGLEEHGFLRRKLCKVPDETFKVARRQAESISVLCAGWPQVQIYQTAFLQFQKKLQKMQISGIRYQLSSRGKTTRLMLRPEIT